MNEDKSHQQVNAGGNESIEIVKAAPAPVVRNMGKVVASYLKGKSLSQRYASGDKQLADIPFMPVLIQEAVIGPNEAPYVGCVVYTTEPFGQTPGVSMAACALGHGKVVVDSLYPTDTSFGSLVGESIATHSVIKVKSHMLTQCSDETFSLCESIVPEEQRMHHVLDLDAQAALHTLAMELNEHYGDGNDVELVVAPKEKIMYIVQRRPGAYKTVLAKPSYLTLEPTQEVMRADIINEGDGKVGLITHPNSVIVEPTLQAALDRVLDLSRASNDHSRVIIVSGEADPLSHAGSELRRMGKIVLKTPETALVTQWLQQQPCKLVVDPQRGIIANVINNPDFRLNYHRAGACSKQSCN